MKSDGSPAPSRTQLWLAASIILVALVVGGVTLIQVWQDTRLPAPPAVENTILVHTIPAASATPAPTNTEMPTATFTPIPAATATPPATRRAAATPPIVRAKIEIVWPHDGAAVRNAELANITVYLINGSGISGGTGMEAPPCDWTPTVRLWRAVNNQPAQEAAIGSKRMLSTGGRTYPVWDFNDIDVADARDPANKLTFFVTVDGVTTLTNIWAHASDARTIFPQADVPTDVTRNPPAAVDARIQIVWPHDNLPLAEATRANITAYLFVAGTLQALAPEMPWRPTVRLHWSVNSEPEQVGSTVIGQSRAVATGTGVQFLAWDFNDVDVSLAQDALNRIYFWVTVDDVTTYSNIWAHGADARTVFPQLDVLNSCR